jgi:hypothetical protein
MDELDEFLHQLPAGSPFLAFRTPTERQVRNLERLRSGRLDTSGPFPDGWVLHYEASWCDEDVDPSFDTVGSNPDEYATAIYDLAAVDEAVKVAQEWLRLRGCREPA